MTAPLLASLLAVASVSVPTPADVPTEEGLYAEIQTPRGAILARLFFEAAPLPVANFVGLAEGHLGPQAGTPFYDHLTFHRVVPDFVIQGGDPLGNGTGGPSYRWPDQFSPRLTHRGPGILSMANSGPDTNGSQFFITLRETRRLDFLHSVFGQVIDGLEILPLVAAGDPMTVRIHRVGAPAQSFGATKADLAALAAQVPRFPLPHLEDPAGLLPTDPPWARILNHRLTNIERFTGHLLYVQLLASPPVDLPEQTARELARLLAERTPSPDRSVAIVFLASTQSWGVWSANATVSDEWNGWLQALLARVGANLEATSPDPNLTAERRLKLLLDELITAATDRIIPTTP